MTRIQIDQFGGYDAAAFLEYLQVENSPVVEVVLPKQTDADSYKHDVLYEYYMGCMTGQILRWMSNEILFGVPPVEKKTEFNFILIEPHLDELAVFLAKAAEGYNEICELDQFYDYVSDETDDFDLDEEQLTCAVLIKVSEEYFEE